MGANRAGRQPGSKQEGRHFHSINGLIEAPTPSEITQLEALAGTTQRAAVDYAIE